MDPSRRRVATPRHRRRLRGVVATVLSIVALTSCDSRRFVTGWLPYWMAATSTQTFLDGTQVFEEVSPFQYETSQTPTSIAPVGEGNAFDDLVAAARAGGVPVLPTIVDHFIKNPDDPNSIIMAEILADPDLRASHIHAIVSLVTTRGYDGIDLDYERFAFSDGSSTWAALKPNWVAFVRELGAELHARQKLLSITVPPIWRTSDGRLMGYWSYAWGEIEPAVDRLRIMVYDWSYSRPGPIAPIWWVRDVLEYAASVMPMSKVQLGIPAYGREWTSDLTGTCPQGVVPPTEAHTMRQIPDLVASTGATPRRDTESGEMTFRYRTVVLVPPDSSTTTSTTSTTAAPTPIDGPAQPGGGGIRLSQCIVTREVWYPDASSWRAAARAALGAGATGVAVWALGYESPQAARAIGRIAATIEGPDGTSPVGRLGRPRIEADGRIRLIGWAFDPEGDLPISVTITMSAIDEPGVSAAERTLLARRPKPRLLTTHPGAGEFHGFRTVMTPPVDTGRVRVCVTASGRYAGPNDVDIGCRTIELD